MGNWDKQVKYWYTELSDHVLKFIGRQHSSEDAINVYKMAREAGFENITVDLMFGIPNQSIEDLQKDLNILKD